MTKLAQGIIHGTATADDIEMLIDNDFYRRRTLDMIAERIEEALIRADQRGELELPKPHINIREDMAKLLTRQISAGDAFPQPGMGRVHMAASAIAWSERLRHLIWSGRVYHIIGYSTVNTMGYRWGFQATSWKFTLVRWDSTKRVMIPWSVQLVPFSF